MKKNEKYLDDFCLRKLTQKVRNWHDFDLTRSAIFHSIKLPFDAEVAGKILDVI